MPIQNTITKEVISIETYKKRCELEDHEGVERGAYREWSSDEIKEQYHKEFQSDEEYEVDND